MGFVDISDCFWHFWHRWHHFNSNHRQTLHLTGYFSISFFLLNLQSCMKERVRPVWYFITTLGSLWFSHPVIETCSCFTSPNTSNISFNDWWLFTQKQFAQILICHCNNMLSHIFTLRVKSFSFNTVKQSKLGTQMFFLIGLHVHNVTKSQAKCLKAAPSFG